MSSRLHINFSFVLFDIYWSWSIWLLVKAYTQACFELFYKWALGNLLYCNCQIKCHFSHTQKSRCGIKMRSFMVYMTYSLHRTCQGPTDKADTIPCIPTVFLILREHFYKRLLAEDLRSVYIEILLNNGYTKESNKTMKNNFYYQMNNSKWNLVLPYSICTLFPIKINIF